MKDKWLLVGDPYREGQDVTTFRSCGVAKNNRVKTININELEKMALKDKETGGSMGSIWEATKICEE